MFFLRHRFCSLFYLALLLLSDGCAPAAKDSAYTLSKAEEKFLKICQEEHQLKPITRLVGGTFWVYLPLEESLIEIKSKMKTPAAPASAPKRPGLQFLDGRFEGNTFFIEYDIIDILKSPPDPGYQSVYAEKVRTIQNNLLTAFSRTFFDMTEESEVPVFFAIVTSDINRGIDIKGILCAQDLKRALSVPPSLSQEEYAKRYVSEIAGDKAAIKDQGGKHLEYKDITWGEFLTKQILNRIRFVYQQSDFPPKEDTETEILKTAAETVRAYGFEDFELIKLRNLRAGVDYTFDKSQLGTFAE